MNTRVCMSCLSVLLLGMTIFGSSDAASDTALPVKLDSTGFTEVLARSGDVYIAGQPTEDALKKLQAEGVTTVVNLRTDAEMNNRQGVPYDERAAVAALGMTYIHLPQGGPDTPYSPATVAALAQAIDDNPGKTLLHCTVAWRASHLWTAYLMRYKDLSLDEAIEHGRAINLGTLPLEGFLGERVTMSVD